MAEIKSLENQGSLGNSAAQLAVAKSYATGSNGVAADKEVAAAWYYVASWNGVNAATELTSLGITDDQGNLTDLGNKAMERARNYLKAHPKADAEARAAFAKDRASAANGDVNAQLRLAHDFEYGIGVDKSDNLLAASWYTLAARNGADLGDKYAELGLTEAQNEQAGKNASDFLKKNPKALAAAAAALKGAEDKASAGDTDAVHMVAAAYAEGTGMAVPDKVTAAAWYYLAQKKGEDVTAELAALKLSDADLKTAKGRAENYVKAHPHAMDNAKAAPVEPAAPPTTTPTPTAAPTTTAGGPTKLAIKNADVKVAAWQEAINAYEKAHGGTGAELKVDGSWGKKTEAEYEKVVAALKLDGKDPKAVINALAKENIALHKEHFTLAAPQTPPGSPAPDKAPGK